MLNHNKQLNSLLNNIEVVSYARPKSCAVIKQPTTGPLSGPKKSGKKSL